MSNDSMISAASHGVADLAAWVAIARGLAERAHAGQTRRNGVPYLTHPAAVAAMVPLFLQPIAWLHDACEDSPLTFDDLRSAGMPEYVVAAVAAISKGMGEDYEVYIERVLANPHAAAVKCADIAHNLSEQPRPDSRKKYLVALPRLLPVAAMVWPDASATIKQKVQELP